MSEDAERKYVSTYTIRHRHVYVYVCMYVCMCVSAYTITHRHVYVYVCVYVCMCVSVCVCLCGEGADMLRSFRDHVDQWRPGARLEICCRMSHYTLFIFCEPRLLPYELL